MELAIRANRVSVGGIRRQFAALGGRLARWERGVVRAAWEGAQAQIAVAARRRLEQQAFGSIGLGGREVFS